jgi:transposase-like protein
MSNRTSRDKSAKFIELAEKRVTRTMNDLKLVRNLTNRNYYEYSDAQAKKIVRALQQEIDILKKSFLDSTAKKEVFKL